MLSCRVKKPGLASIPSILLLPLNYTLDDEFWPLPFELLCRPDCAGGSIMPSEGTSLKPSLPAGLARCSAIAVRAMCVGERIDLSRLGFADRLAQNPYLIALGDDCAATLSRYGVVVFFNTTPEREEALLREIRPLVNQPISRPETEMLTLQIVPDGSEGLESGVVVLWELTIERLQLVGWVLSRSVVLGEYESRVSQDFDRVEPFAVELQSRGLGGRKMSELLKHIGSALLTELKLVGRVEVREKPDLLWEHPELDPLFIRLQAEFELNDRFTALDRKLELISRTVGTVLSLLQNRRSLRVEWYIVALIVMEFMLSIYQWLSR
jgi:hypothetical protein